MSDFIDAVEANARRTVKLMEEKKALKAKVVRLEARIEEVERERDEMTTLINAWQAQAIEDIRVAEARCERLAAILRTCAQAGGASPGWVREQLDALAEEPHTDRGVQIPTENPPSSFRLTGIYGNSVDVAGRDT